MLKSFILVGNARAAGWHAWLVTGLAIGVIASILYVGNNGKFQGGSAESGFKAVVHPHVFCEDVHVGEEVFVNPYTGESTNQFQRRFMSEMRIYVCLPKAIAYLQQMKRESPAIMQSSISNTLANVKKYLDISAVK